MTVKLFFKSTVATLACLAFIGSHSKEAQSQESSSARCEIWLCLPGLMPEATFAGSNAFTANCNNAFLQYIVNVAIPLQTALPDFDSCVSSDYRQRHPDVNIQARAKRSLRPINRFASGWEEYEIEVFQNNIKIGEWTFQHRYNEVLNTRRCRRSGSFGSLQCVWF
ncbi:MAG: hypothetical protein ABJG88_02455 [Litorimonas sp.]